MDAADLIEAQRRHIAGAQNGASARQRRIVREAMRDVQKNLARMRPGSWGDAQQRATMLLLAQGFAQMTDVQAAQLTGDLARVMRLSQQDAAKYLASLDATFHGVARPLRFDSLAWWDQHSKEFGQVRLREFSRSFKRYGASAVKEIEDAIGKTVLMGESWDKARDAVWAATKDVVGDQQWMVDRIVRTEVAAAYNGTTLAALVEEDDPDDPMFKKLVATFDEVTGADSVAVHGQTKPVNEEFVDPKGRRYQAPPNRPHDRELVVGWRTSYGEDIPDFDSETRAEASTAEVRGSEVEPVKPPPAPSPDAVSQVDGELARVKFAKASLGAEAKELQRLHIATRPKPIPAAPVESQRMAISHHMAVGARLDAVRSEIRDVAASEKVLKARRKAAVEAEAPPPPPVISDADALRDGTVIGQPVPMSAQSANETFWVDIQGADGQTRTGVWKPVSGEKDGLRAGIQGGTYYQREAVAYRVDELMGGRGIVPPTVTREVNGQLGSVQLKSKGFVRGEKGYDNVMDKVAESGLDVQDFEDARRLHVLDTLLGNVDRHGRNAMMRWEANELRVVAIDNGLILTESTTRLSSSCAMRQPFLSPPAAERYFREMNNVSMAMHERIKTIDPAALAKVLHEGGIGKDGIRATLVRLRAMQANPDAVHKAYAKMKYRAESSQKMQSVLSEMHVHASNWGADIETAKQTMFHLASHQSPNFLVPKSVRREIEDVLDQL